MSFEPSRVYDWSEGDVARIVELINCDKTGTNDYTIVKITRDTAEDCERELAGQISDGLFENCRVGKIIRED